MLQQKILDAEANKSKVQIISRHAASAVVNPGTTRAAEFGDSFIVRFVSVQSFILGYVNKGHRKISLPQPSQRRARCSRQPVFQRTSFWISFSIVSASISIGR